MRGASSDFWVKQGLGKFADDCILHEILPTIFTTRAPLWDKLRKVINTKDPVMVAAQRDNLHCCLCNSSVEGSLIKVCVRVLVSKTLVQFPTDNVPFFMYRGAFTSGSLCKKCACHHGYVHQMDSNSAMHDKMFALLEYFSQKTTLESIEQDLSGQEFFQRVLDKFKGQHQLFMRTIGKMDTCCTNCGRANPKNICSACKYVRYCSKTCAHVDWPKHKEECQFLKSHSIFYNKPLDV